MSKRTSSILLAALAGLLGTVQAQLPPNFPRLTVTTNYAPAVSQGYIFQGINLATAGAGFYAMVLDNDGAPIWYQELTNACYDVKVLPNGYLHYAEQIRALSYTGGGDVVHQLLDENFYPQETIRAGNGYAAEAHDFQMSPNGNVVLIGYYLSRVDMSQVVPNGNPAALVSGAVVQELNAQRNVVFQWRSWDHYPFSSQWVNSTAAVISAFHINCVFLDNDGNLVISTPDWVKKISRQTGDILWHLGGVENQFTFVGVTEQEGVSHFAGHDINRLANGHVLIYHNSRGNQPGSSSSVHEYALDETNKVATHIWSYTPQPGIAGPFQGSAQRLANDNTFIGWGGLPGLTTAACTEVAGTNVVFQMKFDDTNVVSYRSFRFPYPPTSQAKSVAVNELGLGNSYDFGATGVSIDVQTGGGGYNQVTVTRSPYAPVNPLFQGKAPRVLPLRVSLSENAIETLGATINFDAQSFNLEDPASLTVYSRSQTGQGIFLPQPTSYNPATHRVSANVSLASQGNDLGEFLFAYPDLADIPYPPILNEVVNDRDFQFTDVIAPRMAETGAVYHVNETLPVLLSWSPRGFARSYQFQISSAGDFGSNLVSIPYQTEAFFTWTDAAPDAVYFYRVKTVNEGGESAWSAGSFQTVPPFVHLTFPNGGEAWQRGLPQFIRWNGTLSGNVIIELYRGSTVAATIATNAPDSGAFFWQVPATTPPGSDYSIRVRSSPDATLADTSDSTFSIIDVPSIVPGSVARLPNGGVQFGVAAPGADQVSVLASPDLANWQVSKHLQLSNGNGIFTDPDPTPPSPRFYRLRVP